MLTDVALKNLKPRTKPFKVADRDGMYAHVSTSGLVTFRLDYRLNGRRETVMLGRYSRDGLTLALARERCIDARRASTKVGRLHWKSSERSGVFGRRRVSAISPKPGSAKRPWPTARGQCAARSMTAISDPTGKPSADRTPAG